MLDRIKKRLIHFNTDGASIVSDFVAARQKRAGLLRRVVHACFYIQCAAALVCVVCGFAMGGAGVGIILAVGAAASVGAALMAVSGDFAVRTISYVLDLVYAVICFAAGGTLFTLCGALMLVAAAAALIGFASVYFRGFLLEFSPVKLTPEDYTIIGGAVRETPPPREEPVQQAAEPAPKPEPKSELLLIAEQVSQIMNAPHPQPEQSAPDIPQEQAVQQAAASPNEYSSPISHQDTALNVQLEPYAYSSPRPPQDAAQEQVGESNES